MQLTLKNKYALVLGASQGIGAAIVEAFAEAGAKVIICECQTVSISRISNIRYQWEGSC